MELDRCEGRDYGTSYHLGRVQTQAQGGTDISGVGRSVAHTRPRGRKDTATRASQLGAPPIMPCRRYVAGKKRPSTSGKSYITVLDVITHTFGFLKEND